jgi:hypothetical protein
MPSIYEDFPPPPEDVIRQLLDLAGMSHSPDDRASLMAAINEADGSDQLTRVVPRTVYDRIERAVRELQVALRELAMHGRHAAYDGPGGRKRLADLLSRFEASARQGALDRKPGRPRKELNSHIVWTAAQFLAHRAPTLRPSCNPTSNFARFTELFFEAATGREPPGTLERYIRKVIAARTKPPKNR